MHEQVLSIPLADSFANCYMHTLSSPLTWSVWQVQVRVSLHAVSVPVVQRAHFQQYTRATSQVVWNNEKTKMINPYSLILKLHNTRDVKVTYRNTPTIHVAKVFKYRIEDNFLYGGNFRIFRIEEHHTKISLHNNVNMFYVTMLTIGAVRNTKICTTENYPLYGNY